LRSFTSSESHPFNARSDQEKRRLNFVAALSHVSWAHGNQFEATSPVHLFMDSLKAQSLPKADPSGFSRSHKTEITNEENPPFVYCFRFDAIEFMRECL
jgi:hypothetical protein